MEDWGHFSGSPDPSPRLGPSSNKKPSGSQKRAAAQGSEVLNFLSSEFSLDKANETMLDAEQLFPGGLGGDMSNSVIAASGLAPMAPGLKNDFHYSIPPDSPLHFESSRNIIEGPSNLRRKLPASKQNVSFGPPAQNYPLGSARNFSSGSFGSSLSGGGTGELSSQLSSQHSFGSFPNLQRLDLGSTENIQKKLPAYNLPSMPPFGNYGMPASMGVGGLGSFAAQPGGESQPKAKKAHTSTSPRGAGGGRAASAGGPTLPTMTEVAGDEPLDEKKAKRLAKNRESARASRRKNKEYLERLEWSNTELTNQLREAKWAYLDGCAPELRRLRGDEVRHLHNLWQERQRANRPLTPYEEQMYAEMARAIHAKYGPASAEHRVLCDYEHAELRNKFLPHHQRFLLWLTGQSDQFFERVDGNTSDMYKWTTSNKFIGDKLFSQGKTYAHTDHGGGMWQLLCHEIGISLDQEEKLGTIRRKVRADRASYEERARTTQFQAAALRLGSLTARAGAAAQARVDRLQALVPPTQMWECVAWMQRQEGRLGAPGGALPQLGARLDREFRRAAPGVVALLEKPTEALAYEDVQGLLASLEGVDAAAEEDDGGAEGVNGASGGGALPQAPSPTPLGVAGDEDSEGGGSMVLSS